MRTGHQIVEPFEPFDHDVTRCSTAHPDRLGDAGFVASPVDTFTSVVRSAWVDPMIDAGCVYAQPRGAVGHALVDGRALAEWARGVLPGWRQLASAAQYDEAAVAYCAWVRQREADRLAAVPEAQRAVERVAAERRAADRRAELERQRAATDAELAALDAGQPVPAEPTVPARASWLRRTPTPR
ncbi:MAG: hypothetical protein ACRDRH_05640 [Pseudonocardia sp.]